MDNILNKASYYVIEQFENKFPKGITYHDLSHTTEAVQAAKIIGENSGINAVQFEILLLAAWFHDIGYKEDYNDHEERSAKLSSEFLTEHNYPSDSIDMIIRIILSTKLPHKPANLLEEIMCDSDICYIGKKEFYIRSQVLRVEWENMLGKKFSDLEWIRMNIDFLMKNKFHTKYAKSLYDDHRKENLAKLQKKIRKGMNKVPT